MERKSSHAEEKIRALIAFVVEGKQKGKNLSTLFEEYAEKHGKARGSVRNLYYEILSEGRKDDDFYKEYLEGSGLQAETICEFERGEADRLVKEILIATQSGKSVRAAIREMAGGNEKVALRYQNKYRNVLTGDREKMKALAQEVARETGRPCMPYGKKGASEEISKYLRTEIEGMLRRITARIKKENQELKERAGRLESENLRLKLALRGESSTPMLFLEDVRKKGPY